MVGYDAAASRRSRTPLLLPPVKQQRQVILLQLRVEQAGDGEGFPRKRPHLRRREGRDLEHVHDVGPVDPHELLPRQQLRLVLPEHARDLPHGAVGQVKIQVLLVDLHIHQLGEGNPEEHLPRLQRQPVLRLQLLPIELVQDGVERLG